MDLLIFAQTAFGLYVVSFLSIVLRNNPKFAFLHQKDSRPALLFYLVSDRCRFVDMDRVILIKTDSFTRYLVEN